MTSKRSIILHNNSNLWHTLPQKLLPSIVQTHTNEAVCNFVMASDNFPGPSDYQMAATGEEQRQPQEQ